MELSRIRSYIILVFSATVRHRQKRQHILLAEHIIPTRAVETAHTT